MNELILWLKEREYFWQSPYLFANCSTIGCGGFSALAVYPKTKEELGALLRRLKSAKIDYYILGNLSNVLPPPKMSIHKAPYANCADFRRRLRAGRGNERCAPALLQAKRQVGR